MKDLRFAHSTIQDAETGRELVVEGATPPTPEDMAFLFAEAYRREGGTPRPSDLVVPPDILPPVEEVVPEALPEAVSQPVDPEDELGMLGTFTGATSRGFSRLGSTFTDIIPAIAGSAVGNEEYALEQLAQAEEKRRSDCFTGRSKFGTGPEQANGSSEILRNNGSASVYYIYRATGGGEKLRGLPDFCHRER